MAYGYTNTDQLFQESEVVRKNLAKWTIGLASLANIIPKGNVEMVSERDFRIPALTDLPGREGTHDPNGGEVGRGQNQKGVVMTESAFPVNMRFEITDLASNATKTTTQGVQSNFKDIVKLGIPLFQQYRDRLFFSDGTPVMATATATATVGGVTTYTLNSTFGARRIRRGQYVCVYDTTQATQRLGPASATAFRITNVAWATRIITLAVLVTAAAATDNICFEGITGANPVGMQGLYYWNSSAQTGTTAALNRANEPEIWSNTVSGSGGLNYILGLNLKHAMFERRQDLEVMSGLMGLSGMAQHANAVGNVMNIQRIDLPSGETNSMKDLLPVADGMTFPFAGVKHYVHPFQDNTRLDWISPKEVWGKAVIQEPTFYERGGQRFWPTYGAGGSPNANTWFAMIAQENYWCGNPGAQGFISALPVNAPYA